MKKLVLFSFAVMLLFKFSSDVYACGFCCGSNCPPGSTYVDTYLVHDFSPDIVLNVNEYYDDSFNLADAGMGSEDLLKDADLKIYITDDDCDYSCQCKKQWVNLEYGQLTAEGGTWSLYGWFNDTDSGVYTFDIDTYIGDDHILNYTVSSITVYGKGGDFILTKAKLDLKYCDVPSPVPEPATMLLLGAGLIGIAGFGKKKFNK